MKAKYPYLGQDKDKEHAVNTVTNFLAAIRRNFSWYLAAFNQKDLTNYL
jgi:hypothetical protein